MVVDDVDEAVEFYTDSLGFELRSDEAFEMEGSEGRWVTVGVPGDDLELTLMVADEPYYDADTRALLEAKRGTQTYYTFTTADCRASVEALQAAGVEITREIQEYPWGSEAMFADPSGNEFSIFEYAAA